MKNILLIGATGRTGSIFLEMALDKGHQVSILLRDKKKVTLTHPKLRIIEGNPTKSSDVSEAMKGSDAVESTLNISRVTDSPWAQLTAPPDLLSASMTVVLQCMKEQGISRIIYVSASGVGDSSVEMPGWLRWFFNRTKIGITYRDHQKTEDLLASSGVDWTSVRPVGLTDKDKVRELIVSRLGTPKPRWSISRKHVAIFMLDILEKAEYIRQAPTISER